MDDFLYLENGEVKISDVAMEIPEFKDFKRYDSSTNKVFFNKSMAYIFYVYQVFGSQRSPLRNRPLPQRRKEAVQHYTGTYKNVSDFEKNKWVKNCIESYLKYSRTQNENMFDALKDDIEHFIELVNNTPHTIKQKVTVYHKIAGDDFETPIDVMIEVPNSEARFKLLKQASDLNDLFQKKQLDVEKDAKTKKNVGIRLFESKESTKDIPLDTFPISKK